MYVCVLYICRENNQCLSVGWTVFTYIFLLKAELNSKRGTKRGKTERD